MKKNFKFLALGIVIGALTVNATALADIIWEKIDVVRNRVVVMVNGEKIEADNFLYNDTTYVPIRAVAEALGQNVDYEDGIAYIGGDFGARFGGEKVTYLDKYEMTTEEIDAYVQVLSKDSENASLSEEQLEELAKKSIVQYNIIEDLAKEAGITLGAEFKDNYTNTMAFLGMQYGGEESLAIVMEQSGFSQMMYKRYLQTNYLKNKLVQSDAYKATEEEISKYYSENAEKYSYNGVKAQHILLKTTDENGTAIADEAKLKEIETRAKNIYKQAISRGGNFDELIAKYNEDPGMKQNPQGYVFTKGEMVAEFEKAAFSLKDGQISEPVKSVYGWHIIKKICDVKTQPLTDELSDTIATTLSASKVETAISTNLTKALEGK